MVHSSGESIDMMAGNPNSCWSMVPLPQPHHHQQQPSTWIASPTSSPSFPSLYVLPSSSPPSSLPPENHELPPQSWSQLLFGGMPGDKDRYGPPSHYQSKKQENWEDQTLHPSLRLPHVSAADHVKQENGKFYGQHVEEGNNFQTPRPPWSHQVLPVSSPRSCITSTGSNMLDFSYTKEDGKVQHPDQTSECNSTATCGMCKKARLQPSSNQPPLKVRKEKLGDRITALHQLVSPFGKTDTASVLLEAIGYIRFHEGQIESLSTPYLGSTPSNMRSQQSVQGERNCVFPEDPGQLLNDICLKRKGAPSQDGQDNPKDLRSRGLCLVPMSCTQYIGNDINGADYWAPAIGGGF